MHILNIASGSSGNCTYVGNGNAHYLVDCGISCKKIIAGLKKINLTLDDITAILISHEHVDHIKGLGVVLRKKSIPVLATKGTIDAMLYSGSLGKVNDKLFMPIETDCNYSMDPYSDDPDEAGYIRFIPISHDAKDPVCFVFGTKTAKAVIATDLGIYDKRLVKCLKNSDYYLIESNHDVRMLEANPRYNYHLKRRILGEGGHLSNEQAGEFMIELTDNGKFMPKHIVLGHLSKDNNIPEAALQSMKNILSAAKIDISGVNIFTALRDEPSEDVYI